MHNLDTILAVLAAFSSGALTALLFVRWGEGSDR